LNLSVTRIALAAVCLSFSLLPAAHAADTGLAARLHRAAPQLAPGVLKLALQARRCAVEQGGAASDRLGVIDYSRPSTEPRLWVFDLERARLLFQELVAHGRNSGDNYARDFSNADGSLASSLGLFRTLDPYDGHNGYSLRMEGLEPGVNDHALERAIVIHGASYVSWSTARREGRIGRSWGCPAVSVKAAPRVIDALKGGQYLFAYYPDPHWLESSPYLHCGNATVAGAP
jgi:hypothetical protein